MSTWDDKPNDYQHALLIIERLSTINAELVAALQAMYEEFQHSNDFRPDSMIARKARATLIKAKEALQ